MKILQFILLGLIIFPTPIIAADQNFITPVFPVRARQYWRQSQDIQEVKRLSDLVIKYKLPSTWLLHYDVLFDNEIIQQLTTYNSQLTTEYGLFLEITRKLAEDSFVKYDWTNGHWSQADKVFLSGYTREERIRMIDKAFNSFKDKFSYYPVSYGTWYVDIWSMEYIRDKYGADIVLGLSDQYSTDGYQTWGQWWNLPYYVSRGSAIEPAYDIADSTRVLKLQWAPRHPVLGYGQTVDSSNYSAQVNDYHRGKNLKHQYFLDLLTDLTVNVKGPISQTVIGIEVGELEAKYFPELEAQLKLLRDQETKKIINNLTMKQFSKLYRNLFPDLSPPTQIIATDSGTTVKWQMDNLSRTGIKIQNGQAEIFDQRFYHQNHLRDNDQLWPDVRQNLARVVPATSSGQPPAVVSDYGQYSKPFPKLKEFIVLMSRFVPDLVYSNISGQKYFGLRTDFEHLIGIRIPDFKISRFYFPFTTLSNFISLKSQISPHFSWFGRQESEVAPYSKKGELFSKGQYYGQDELLKKPEGKLIFENGYYAVYSKQ